MNKNARRVLVGSAAFMFAGLAWKVLEDEILRLKSLAFINETAAQRAAPDDKSIYQKRFEFYQRRLNIAEVAHSLIPFSYPALLRNVYSKYLRSHYESGRI